MDWREILKTNTSDTYMENVKNMNKVKKSTYSPFSPYSGGDSKLKTCWNCFHLSLEKLPGLCLFIPENKPIPVSLIDIGCEQFKAMNPDINKLWIHAHKMADYTDGSKAPYSERKALVPAIFSIGKVIDKIKDIK